MQQIVKHYPENGLAYARICQRKCRTAAVVITDKAWYDRPMETLIKREANAATLVYPKTIKCVERTIFLPVMGLRSVVMNEGLETVGNHVLTEVMLKELTIPASVREIGSCQLQNGSYPSKIIFEENS